MAVDSRLVNQMRKGSVYDPKLLVGLSNEEKNAIYWHHRLGESASKKWDDVNYYNKKLITKYKQSIGDIKKDVNAFYGKYAIKNEMTLTEARKYLDRYTKVDFNTEADNILAVKNSGRISETEYRKRVKALRKRKQIQRYEALVANIEDKIRNLGIFEEDQLRKLLEDTYSKSWKNVSSILREHGITEKTLGAMPNARQIDMALKYPWSGKMFSENIWHDKLRLIQTVDRELMKGIVQGLNPREVGKNIDKVMNTGLYNATRVARTETMFIVNRAHLDCYKEAGITHYQFSAFLDDRVSQVCTDHDLSIIKEDEAVVGENVPPLHPNCRSVLLPYWVEAIPSVEEPKKTKKDPKKDPKKKTEPKKKDKFTPLDEQEVIAEMKKMYPNLEMKFGRVNQDLKERSLNTFNTLSKKYKLNNGRENFTNYRISSKTVGGRAFDKTTGGSVGVNISGRQTYQLNSRYFKNKETLKSYYNQSSFSIVDADRVLDYVPTHEFGHMIITERGLNTETYKLFFKELKESALYKEHIKLIPKIQRVLRGRQDDIAEVIKSEFRLKAQKGSMGNLMQEANDKYMFEVHKMRVEVLEEYRDYVPSYYSMTNTNELIAEGFAEFELSGSPHKMGKLIGDLITKYYGVKK